MEKLKIQLKQKIKKKLAEIIYSDAEARQKLNDCTFKYIKKEIERQISKTPKDTTIIIDAPLLFESQLDKICDKIIGVISKRELQEETGAVDFRIEPICVYSVKGKTRVNENIDDETFGMLFIADINSFEELHSEIEKILISDKLVENWTYPLIQPILIEEAKKRGFI